jgi:site-specific recombinase XerD
MDTKTFTDKCLNEYKAKLELRRYSKNTRINYVSSFVLHHFNVEIDTLQDKDICNYVLSECKGKSNSHQNTLINAIKFYFEKVRYRKRKFYKIDRPKQTSKLPQVICHENVMKSITSISNIKHKAIVSIAYSVGLRVSEVTNLKVTDIDSKRMLIHVNGAKGDKDRIVPLSENVLVLLREYYKQYRPKTYLFESYKEGTKYSVGSCQKIWQKYKLDPESTFHTLRHSFATNLVEKNVSLRVIQELLGHKNSKTTEIYTHVSNSSLKKVPLPL